MNTNEYIKYKYCFLSTKCLLVLLFVFCVIYIYSLHLFDNSNLCRCNASTAFRPTTAHTINATHTAHRYFMITIKLTRGEVIHMQCAATHLGVGIGSKFPF